MAREMADFDADDFESREAADKSVYVKFYTKPVQNEAKSAAEGRPMFDEKEYVEIRTPGNQNNVIQRPVTDMDRQRFRAAYRRFKEGHEEQLVGTPLTEAPWLTRAQVEELSHLRVRTIEHLADLDDGVCSRYAGMYGLKQKAQAYIARAKDNAPFQQMQKDNEELRNTLETMKQTIADQSAIIKTLQEKVKE